MSIEIKKKARIKQLEAQVASIKEDSQSYLEKAQTRSEELVKAREELNKVKQELHEALLKLASIVHILKPYEEPLEIVKGGLVKVSFVGLHKMMPNHAMFKQWPLSAHDVTVDVVSTDVVRQFSRLANVLPQGTPTVHVRFKGVLFSVPREVCTAVKPHADI